MSLIKSIMHQLGLSGDPAKNFTLSVPAAPDGTMKLARGNAGATTQDIMTVDAAGKVAFPAQGQLLSGNGYIKLPGGLIIQWGQSAGPTAALSGSIAFPIPFPNGLFNIILSSAYASGLGGGQMFVVSNDVNGFTWNRNDPANPKHLFWIAIGA